MNSMKLLKMADGRVIEKNANCNSCSLFNKTPMVVFEGGGEKSKEADDTDSGVSSASWRRSNISITC